MQCVLLATECKIGLVLWHLVTLTLKTPWGHAHWRSENCLDYAGILWNLLSNTQTTTSDYIALSLRYRTPPHVFMVFLSGLTNVATTRYTCVANTALCTATINLQWHLEFRA